MTDAASDAVGRNAPVVMVRPTLAGLPAAAPPPGCTLRGYRAGDERAWTAIQRAADRYNAIGADLFACTFGADPAVLAARVLFVDDADGRPVGTAAAWTGDGAMEDWGRLHWVAVVPALQGRGLGRALVAAALGRMASLGSARAYLTTSAARLPAIRLYRALGFEPLRRDDADRAAWTAIGAALGDPGLGDPGRPAP